MESELYCLKFQDTELLDYVFKRLKGERFLIDPDLKFVRDIAYRTDDDAEELIARAFTLEEARAARLRLLDLYAPYCGTPRVDFVCIDPQDPLSTFIHEQRLLRIVEWDDDLVQRERLEGLSCAWPCSREDGTRFEGKLFYRRKDDVAPQECYAVEAIRINPPAKVVARFGHGYAETPGSRTRAERFGFVEWNTCGSRDMQQLATSACRLLQAQEAEAIAASLAADESFHSVRVTKGTLREMDADEGLGVSNSDQPYSHAGVAQEAAVGFPHFLSVFPLDDELGDSARL